MNKQQLKLLQKSIDNIHYQQIKNRVNLEAEILYAKTYIGSPMPDQAKYNEELGLSFIKSKIINLW